MWKGCLCILIVYFVGTQAGCLSEMLVSQTPPRCSSHLNETCFNSIWSIWHVLVGMHDIFLWSPASGFQSYAPFSYILINPYILIFCDKAEWWLLFYSQSVILSSRFFRILYSLSDTWCVNEVFWFWNVLLLHRHSNVPCWIQHWFCDSSKYLGVIGWCT